MVSFNSVVLAGHLARDPELRYTGQGRAVCDLAVAINRRWTRENGEKGEEVTFVDVTVWNRLAEVSAEFLKKGRAVLVAGHLLQDRWEDSSTGQKRSKLKVVAERVQFLGRGPDEAGTPLEDASTEEPGAASDPALPNGANVAKSRKR